MRPKWPSWKHRAPKNTPGRSTMRLPEALLPRNPTWESSHFWGLTNIAPNFKQSVRKCSPQFEGIKAENAELDLSWLGLQMTHPKLPKFWGAPKDADQIKTDLISILGCPLLLGRLDFGMDICRSLLPNIGVRRRQSMT